jgi:hypothetical protein
MAFFCMYILECTPPASQNILYTSTTTECAYTLWFVTTTVSLYVVTSVSSFRHLNVKYLFTSNQHVVIVYWYLDPGIKFRTHFDFKLPPKPCRLLYQGSPRSPPPRTPPPFRYLPSTLTAPHIPIASFLL